MLLALIVQNLSFNSRDFTWSISNAYRDEEGYVDTKKIQVQFFDLDDDGVVDDLDLFDVLAI